MVYSMQEKANIVWKAKSDLIFMGISSFPVHFTKKYSG